MLNASVNVRGALIGLLVALAVSLGAALALSAPAAPALAGAPVVTVQGKAVHVAKAAKAKKYDIIFKLNGGKQASRQVVKVKAGKTVKVSKLKAPKRAGYLFTGWYANKKLTKQAETVAGVASKAKRTVYAKWVKKKTYKITYKLDGGMLYGSYVKQFKNSKAVKNLPTPIKPGYAFSGWYSDKKLAKQVTRIPKAVSKNQTLYAKWEPLEYRIAYVLNAKGASMPAGYSSTYTVANPLEALPVPERPGYSFLGWYSDTGLTTLVGSLPDGLLGNKVLFAKWEKRFLVAHRGLASDDAPENSLAAFRAASERGFGEIETDVRFTSDGVPVIVHDPTVPLLVEAPEAEGALSVVDTAVSALTYEELQTADLHTASKAGEDGRNLPTFEEALDACNELGLRMSVHVKTEDDSAELTDADEANIETLILLAEGHGMQGSVRWYANSPWVLRYVLQCRPGASMVYSSNLDKTMLANAKELVDDGADLIACTTRGVAKGTKLNRFKSAGIRVGVWSCANESKLTGLDQYISMALLNDLLADRVPDQVVY